MWTTPLSWNWCAVHSLEACSGFGLGVVHKNEGNFEKFGGHLLPQVLLLEACPSKQYLWVFLVDAGWAVLAMGKLDYWLGSPHLQKNWILFWPQPRIRTKIIDWGVGREENLILLPIECLKWMTRPIHLSRAISCSLWGFLSFPLDLIQTHIVLSSHSKTQLIKLVHEQM